MQRYKIEELKESTALVLWEEEQEGEKHRKEREEKRRKSNAQNVKEMKSFFVWRKNWLCEYTIQSYKLWMKLPLFYWKSKENPEYHNIKYNSASNAKYEIF